MKLISLASDEFYAAADATKAKRDGDHIIYNKTTGDLYYDADGKGGVDAVSFATLSNHPGHLDFGDFVIVSGPDPVSVECPTWRGEVYSTQARFYCRIEYWQTDDPIADDGRRFH